MPLYLCGQAALDVTRYLRATNDGEIPGIPARPRRLGDALYTNRQLNTFDESAQRLLAHVRGKVEAMVPTSELHAKTERLETHVWCHDIPRGAFINLGNGIFLSSPAFLFMQLAPQLSEIDLITLGLEFCGSYSCWGFPSLVPNAKVEDEFRVTTYQLRPALNAARLSAFVEHMEGERGSVRARWALKYVIDNAASPMESAVYLLLSLPRRLGGRGLPAPLFNAKVAVTTSVSTEYRFPDLYWPTKGVDVEYQSDEKHSGSWSRYRDARREIELVAEHITVLPLTRHQIMDAEEFNAFAVSVRRALGLRSRTLTPAWYESYLALRQKLLFER